MKVFRLVRAGFGVAFVLLVGIQPLVGAASITPSVRQLSFKDRVAYQRAIEEVYWRHRIWPRGGGARPDPKPSLDAVISQAAIERKVQDYLRNSELLEKKWQKQITSEQLQDEMDRMAQHTKQPGVLRELFAALGSDPFVIAECLARPVLLERLQFATVKSRNEPFESRSATEAQDQMLNVVATAAANYALPAISDQPSGCIDDWTATSTTNAPSAREFHTAVWTGSEMIVWGGSDGITRLNTGGRYNPSTDSWTSTSTSNAPIGRAAHTAVWTGSEMIVWGGRDLPNSLNTGGRYNPGTDSWTATSTADAPSARYSHTAVWTGSEMIVWGGGYYPLYLSTGGRYDPNTDRWTSTNITDAPIARGDHTAVWTGNEMIIWGGFAKEGALNTGGNYNPSTESWTAISTTNAATARWLHKAVWTGSEMIVWGGSTGNGGDPVNTGGRYNPGTDSWMATSRINAPAGRDYFTAVWTGNEMIVWGGYFAGADLDTGGRYNPTLDSWMATANTNAPTARREHTAVWTGGEMIIWGGTQDITSFYTGGRYCGPPAITLEAQPHRQGGNHLVALTWSPADGGSVNVLRDGIVIGVTDDDGEAQDRLWNHQGIFTYQVCETDSGDCSNEVTVRVGGSYD